MYFYIPSLLKNSSAIVLCRFSQMHVQYIPRNMHTVFALLCFVVVIHWLIFPYPSGLLHWHWGNLTIAPMPAKQPWWIWINTSCEFIMNDCITTTKQSTTKPCAYFLGYTVYDENWKLFSVLCWQVKVLMTLLFVVCTTSSTNKNSSIIPRGKCVGNISYRLLVLLLLAL